METQCPKCKEIFSVSDDMLGKKAACGVCGHVFTVSKYISEADRQPVVVGDARRTFQGKKHVSKFFKKGIDVSEASIPEYGEQGEDEAMPWEKSVQPIQYILGSITVILVMISIGLFLFNWDKVYGAWGGFNEKERWFLCILLSVSTFLFCVFSFRKHRTVSYFIATALSVFILASPKLGEMEQNYEEELARAALIAQKSKEELHEPEKTDADFEDETINTVNVTRPPEYLENNIQPLIKKLKKDPSAFGVWINDSNVEMNVQIGRWMQRIVECEGMPAVYDRGDKRYLFVVTGKSLSLEDIYACCRRLGTVQFFNLENRLVVVNANQNYFRSKAIKSPSLANYNRDDFYAINYQELQCFDVERVREACLRLEKAPTKLLRQDIVNQLLILLHESLGDLDNQEQNISAEIARALVVFAPANDARTMSALKNYIHAVKKSPVSHIFPKSVVQYMVNSGNADSWKELVMLWKDFPSEWENVFLQSKSNPEVVLSQLVMEGNLSLSQKRSLAKILKGCATQASLPALTILSEDKDTGVRVDAEVTLQRLNSEVK